MKTIKATFRNYSDADRHTCLGIFDANCPEFFAPDERADYEEFLVRAPSAYEVCEVEGRIVGAFGLFDDGADVKRLNWILLDPHSHGAGIGQQIMAKIITLARKSHARQIRIAASQKSSAFFAKSGAETVSATPEGWGPGLDRVDMVLVL